MNRNPFRFFLWLIPSIILAVTSFCALDKTILSVDNEIHYLPNCKYVNTLSFGHRESVASLFWISALTEYGGSLFGAPEFTLFSSYANLTTTLDSLMYMPYYFISATASHKDSSTIKLLDRAMITFPKDWRLGLYYSMYLTRIYGDFGRAATVMDQFTNIDSVPAFVKRLPQSLRIKQIPKKEACLLLFRDYIEPSNLTFRLGIEKQMLDIFNLPGKQDSIELHEALQSVIKGNTSPEQGLQAILALDNK